MKRLHRIGIASSLVLLLTLTPLASARPIQKNSSGTDDLAGGDRSSAYVDTDQEKRDKEERDRQEQERQRQEQQRQQEQERQRQQQQQEQERQRQEQLRQQQQQQQQQQEQQKRDQELRDQQLKQQQDQLRQQQQEQERQRQAQELQKKNQDLHDQQLKQAQELHDQQLKQQAQEQRDKAAEQKRLKDAHDQALLQQQREQAAADKKKNDLLASHDGKDGGGRGDGGGGGGGRGDGGGGGGGRGDGGGGGGGGQSGGGGGGGGGGTGGGGHSGGGGGGGTGGGTGHSGGTGGGNGQDHNVGGSGGTGHSSGGSGSQGQSGGGIGTGSQGQGGSGHTWGGGGGVFTGGGSNGTQTGNSNGDRGGNHNGSRDHHGSPITIGRPPVDSFPGDLHGRVQRDNDIHARDRDHWRSGYFFYFVDANWCDVDFFYPYYCYEPVWDVCVISPWYYYPHLPGYIGRNRIIFVANPDVLYLVNGPMGCYWTSAPSYNWSPPTNDQNPGYTSDLDYALEDLRTAFTRNDRRAMGRLIPRSGRVGIYVDEKYSYSLPADDFYDLMLDNVTTTKTVSYDIVDVRTHGDEARVVARHEYTDTWGRHSVVYHTYRLQAQRGGYVIVDFGTSSDNPHL